MNSIVYLMYKILKYLPWFPIDFKILKFCISTEYFKISCVIISPVQALGPCYYRQIHIGKQIKDRFDVHQ